MGLKAGELGFEPRSQILEIRMLPLHHSPIVGHLGIEPRTSVLSGLRANQLCQCPEASPVPSLYVTGHRETDYTHMYTISRDILLCNL